MPAIQTDTADKIHVDIWSKPLPEILPADLFRPAEHHGAEVCFWGRIRNLNQGRKVKSLSYDAFVPLAKRTLLDVAREARQRWGDDLHITAIHRTGTLELGENAVVVAVSSAHRQEAFDACQYVIEELKHRAPIWKKEHYFDGESEWLQGHALCQHGAPRTSVRPAQEKVHPREMSGACHGSHHQHHHGE